MKNTIIRRPIGSNLRCFLIASAMICSPAHHAPGIGPGEVAVPREEKLSERFWELLQALHVDDYQRFCEFAAEPLNGETAPFDSARYREFQRCLRPFTKKGFTVQFQETARPLDSPRHWYRAWLTTLPRHPGKSTSGARTASIIIVYDVEESGRPIVNIAINPNDSGRRISESSTIEERRFESPAID